MLMQTDVISIKFEIKLLMCSDFLHRKLPEKRADRNLCGSVLQYLVHCEKMEQHLQKHSYKHSFINETELDGILSSNLQTGDWS